MTQKSQCIWKFSVPLFIGDTFKIEMPRDAKILCVRWEAGAPDPYLFALAQSSEDNGGKYVKRTFNVYATGAVWHEEDLERDGMTRESTFKTYVGSFEVDIAKFRDSPRSPIWQSQTIDMHAQNYGGQITCHLFEVKPALV